VLSSILADDIIFHDITVVLQEKDVSYVSVFKAEAYRLIGLEVLYSCYAGYLL
jgi:hypothetical protein